jgi:signal transduction histidine kinase
MTLAKGQLTTLGTEDPLSSGKGELGSAAEGTFSYISGVVIDGIRRVEPNMVPVALCAAIMFPAYWFVWKFLFPQPYENIWLRLFGSLLCVIVATKDQWPRKTQAYLPLVWLATVLYSGPFFFTFMLLQNNSSTIWLLSTMAGLFLVVLLLDWISLFTLFVVGSLLAWRIHLMWSPAVTAVNIYLEFVPIFLFALTAGTIFNYRAAGLRQAKERARQELGVLLAKEMETPLVSMRTNGASLGRFLPLLIAAQRDAAQRDQDRRLEAGRYCLTGSQLNALERVPGRVEEAVEQMQAIIDVLMTEAGQTVASRRRASSMLRCVDDAIARLPFAADLGRERIIADRHHDFLFYGSPVLMAHVLARVLEASLNEACTKTGADLVLALGHSAGRNYLRLTDSMADFRGIGSRLLSGVFRRDRDMNFEKRPDLALANFVLERMGGMVVRSLLLGHAQETMFWFPQVATELDPRDRSD